VVALTIRSGADVTPRKDYVVHRPGSVSSNPAALVAVDEAVGISLNVRVESSTSVGNSLTFGLATSMAPDSSGGFGGTCARGSRLVDGSYSCGLRQAHHVPHATFINRISSSTYDDQQGDDEMDLDLRIEQGDLLGLQFADQVAVFTVRILFHRSYCESPCVREARRGSAFERLDGAVHSIGSTGQCIREARHGNALERLAKAVY
jgi:hypothetical protein